MGIPCRRKAERPTLFRFCSEALGFAGDSKNLPTRFSDLL